MKTLYLLRHAESSWKEDGGKDLNRPLSEKGNIQADQVSDHLSSLIPPPQRVLSSPALRTRQTLDYFLEVWPLKAPDVLLDPELYLAGSDRLFAALRELRVKKEIVMIVGHNPGLTDFARSLLPGDGDPLPSLPTCAFLQIDFDIPDWKSLTPHSGNLKLNLRPKQLED